jgi:hypothetical protein
MTKRPGDAVPNGRLAHWRIDHAGQDWPGNGRGLLKVLCPRLEGPEETSEGNRSRRAWHSRTPGSHGLHFSSFPLCMVVVATPRSGAHVTRHLDRAISAAIASRLSIVYATRDCVWGGWRYSSTVNTGVGLTVDLHAAHDRNRPIAPVGNPTSPPFQSAARRHTSYV